MKFNTYTLRKWAKAARLRDNNTCQMCSRKDGPNEVHHIYPKSLYPKKAYLLKNAITLCFICHKGIVHAGNTFKLDNWNKFVPMFNYQMRLKQKKDFNNKYQHRIYKT